MSYTYPYPRPALTVDIIAFLKIDESISVLLIKRKNEPYAHKWALPGGFVDQNEYLEAAAYRELSEETGLKKIVLKQFKTFGDPGRDPRGHTVSVVFFGFVDESDTKVSGSDDATEAKWFNINNLPPLAFDHDVIITMAIKELL